MKPILIVKHRYLSDKYLQVELGTAEVAEVISLRVFFFFENFFIYVKGRVRGRDRQGRDREIFHRWFTPQMATWASNGPGQRPIQVFQACGRVPKHLSDHPLLFQAQLQAAGLEVQQLRLEPVFIWDASVMGSGLICYDIMLAPILDFRYTKLPFRKAVGFVLHLTISACVCSLTQSTTVTFNIVTLKQFSILDKMTSYCWFSYLFLMCLIFWFI